MNASIESYTRLSGARLRLARTVWLLLVGSILLMCGLVAYEGLFEPLAVCETQACSMTPAQYAAWQAVGIRPEAADLAQEIVFGIAVPLAYFLIAVIIAWRRSDDWMGLLVSFSLIGLGPYLLAGVNLTMSTRPGWNLVAIVLLTASAFAFISLFYLFPDGRLVPRWTRWLLLGFALVWITSGIIDIAQLLTGSGTSAPVQSAPIGTGLIFVLFFVGLGSQVYRYRRVSNAVQRQQTKWVIVGLLGPILTLAIWFGNFFLFDAGALPIVWQLILLPVMALFNLTLPASIGFAILRYRLWDIDVIIRKTLVYSILTGLLALIYFGGVVLVQQLTRSITASSDLAIVVSTLVIAALFFPLRRRVQNAIDRRFYRRKYDAQQVLAHFAATARDEVELDKLTAELINVVNETMQPASVSLWLRESRRKSE